jgi:non-canonical (house-cleaning) NTP pyrophosphatase
VATAPQQTHSGYAGRALTTGSREGQAGLGLVTGHQVTNVGGASGAYQASSAAGKTAFDSMHRAGTGKGWVHDQVDLSGAHAAAERAANKQWAEENAARTPLPTAPKAPGVDPGAAAGGPPVTPVTPQGPYTPQAADYSRYDAAAQELKASRDVFQNELTRLSGVDPFGNQAFLQKATDRAVSQAAGTAAMARGGAAAQAGAQRAQQGVQSQLASRGIQEMEQTVARDANTAAGLRLTAASGMADVSSRLAQNEVEFANKAADVGVANLNAAVERYGIDANVGQRERESLRSLATEMQKIDMERYKTDMSYRMNVDDNIIAKYVSDNALSGVLAQIEASENISTGEAIMGILGAGAGIAQGVVMKSDRRSKYAIRAPRAADLKEYLGTTKGSMYRYRSPSSPGQREGENFGPMAQDLRKSKIGRTVVVEKADGLYVDTGRLALADHGALAALAQRVERLAARVAQRGSKK